MARDYAKKNTTKKPKRKKNTQEVETPSLIMWIIALILITLFISGLFYLHRFKQHSNAHKVLAPLAKGHHVKKNNPIKFEFYSSLSKNIDDEPTLDKPNKTPMAPAVDLTHKQQPPKTTTHHYLIQVASFKHYQDADDTKAKLLLSGFTGVDVKKVKVNNVDWYRVIIGPYANLKDIKKIQQQLQKKHIQSLLIKED